MDLTGEFLPDLGDIAGGVYPFFGEATGTADIPGYLDSMKDGPSHPDIISSTVAANLTGNSNDFGGTALRAFDGIFHTALLTNRAFIAALRH